MRAITHWRPRALLPALLLALGAPLAARAILTRPLAAGQDGAAALPRRDAPATLPPALPRLAWLPLRDSTIAAAAGFTRLGDTVVVLDARTQQIVLLRAVDGAWRQVGSFGRRGGGPGELQRPVAIAGVGDTAIAVIEMNGRIQRFHPSGAVQGAERAALPCPMFAPVLAYGDGGVRYLSGNCAGRGAAADTVFSVVFQAVADGEYTELLRAPRMATDLSWGSILATMHPLVEGADAIRFSLGLDDCVHELPRATHARSPAPRCALVHERLRSPPPPSLAARRAEARRRGDARLELALRWPESLPVHMGMMRAGDELLLLRPVSGDSAALVPAGARFDATAIRLVTPLMHLVACTRDACLWLDAERGRMALFAERESAEGRRSRGEGRG